MRAENGMPKIKDLVLVGGGHSHVFVLKSLGMNPIPGVQITLVSKDIETPYSGMLPGYVLGLYAKDDIHIDLNKLAQFSRTRLIHSSVIGMSRKDNLIYLGDGRPPLRYDVCSYDVGIVPEFIANKNPSTFFHVTPVKPISYFCVRWDSIVEKIRASPRHDIENIVVVGGGVAGVEVVLAMEDRIRRETEAHRRDSPRVSFSLISRNPGLLASRGDKLQLYFERLLRSRGITLHLGSGAADVFEEGSNRGYILLENGKKVPFNEAFLCTSGKAAEWLQSADLDLHTDGSIKVMETLQTMSDPNIFATGDCAHMVATPRPKAGVFAVRQGPPLSHNIRCLIEGKRLKPFKPQSKYLSIMATGLEKAVAIYGSMSFNENSWVWRFKRHIDENWMKQYSSVSSVGDSGQSPPNVSRTTNGGTDNPSAEKSELNTRNSTIPAAYIQAGTNGMDIYARSKSRCGGCGSKVDNNILSRVIQTVRHAEISESHQDERIKCKVLKGLSDPDDCAIVMPPDDKDVAMVHSVDFFRAHISDPYLFGKITANHALSDVHAMGAQPSTALAIAVVPFGSPDVQLMQGALEMFKDEGCQLIGGHTSEGSELGLGFSVNATVRLSDVVHKGGMKAGSIVVLTKAIGTGAILAADMHCKCKASWLSEAIESMLQSNRRAAEVFQRHGVEAMTDVTGFGLVGHLIEMINASNEGKDSSEFISVSVTLDSISTLKGAIQCIQRGEKSSLHSSNEKSFSSNVSSFPNLAAKIKAANIMTSCTSLEDDTTTPIASAKYQLIFDPQTAGGLLASLPAEEVEDCIKELRSFGYKHSSIIGNVVESKALESAGFYRYDEAPRAVSLTWRATAP